MDNLPEITQAAAVRLITSAKGGVGKSTVCANLGMALALMGKRVLLIDCDTANRCLDLLLGLEDTAMWGIRDVCEGTLPLSDAIYPSPTQPNLHLLPGSRVTADAINEIVSGLPACIKEAGQLGYDHILIDTPGGLHEILFAAAALCEEALIVSSAQNTAIRSAEQTADLLSEHGVPAMRLIVNQFMPADALTRRRSSARARNAAVTTLIAAVDSVSLSLLGVIPFDAGLWEAQNKGQLIDHPAAAPTHFAAAHRNIAQRLTGRTVPLFSDGR